MDERDSVGITYVVREIVSGPTDLEDAVPTEAVTLSCLASLGGDGEFWCAQLEQPVKHRISQTVDGHRYHPDYLDRDELGPFF